MSERRAPIGEFMPRSSPPVEAVAALWRRLEESGWRSDQPDRLVPLRAA